MKARYTALARSDLQDIWLYIAQDSETAADRLLDRLIDAAIPLEAFPELGIARPDLGDGVRSLAVGAYLIFYRPREGGVVIERVLDGRRDIGPRFF